MSIENPSAEQHSLIGAALSFEFPECSIAAADLSVRVGELLESDSEVIEYYQPEDDLARKLVVANGCHFQDEFTLNGHGTSLVLARSSRREDIPKPPESVQRTSLLRRHVQVNNGEKQEEADYQAVGDPFLAIKIGRDSVLPIATFARRKGGQCSYVQLGQEMEDDSYYVTTADDESSRRSLVEALRFFADNYGERDKRGNWVAVNEQAANKQLPIIQQFIDQQAEIHAKALDKMYEASFVRNSYSLLKERGTEKSLSVLGADTETAKMASYATLTLTQPCILNDGRRASLMLAGQMTDGEFDPSQQLQLICTTTGGIAVPIANLSSNFNSVDFIDEGSAPMDQPARASMIRDLLFLVVDPITMNKTDFEQLYNTDKMGDEDARIAEYCKAKSLLSEEYTRSYNDHYGTRHLQVSVPAEVIRKLDLFFVYPSLERLPYEESAPLKLVWQRLNYVSTLNHLLMDRLGVQLKLAEHLPEVRECDDILLSYVDRLAQDNKELTATFNNMQIGDTRGDAELSIIANFKDGNYQLTISGRPSSMPDEPRKRLLNLTLDPMQPNLGQKESNRLFRDTDVDEIVDIISRIMNVHGAMPKILVI